jgi:hypothetical protein
MHFFAKVGAIWRVKCVGIDTATSSQNGYKNRGQGSGTRVQVRQRKGLMRRYGRGTGNREQGIGNRE